MRLIDADNFKQLVTVVSIANGESAAFVNEFCELIDSQPTAYDVDKVVERLDKERSRMYYEDGSLMLSRTNVSIDKAVEIVRSGGIE